MYLKQCDGAVKSPTESPNLPLFSDVVNEGEDNRVRVDVHDDATTAGLSQNVSPVGITIDEEEKN